MITKPRLWNEPFDIARRLVEKVESQDLKTPGAWVDWIQRVKRLPVRCRQWVWRKAGENLPGETIRYLQSWRR